MENLLERPLHLPAGRSGRYGIGFKVGPVILHTEQCAPETSTGMSASRRQPEPREHAELREQFTPACRYVYPTTNQSGVRTQQSERAKEENTRARPEKHNTPRRYSTQHPQEHTGASRLNLVV